MSHNQQDLSDVSMMDLFRMEAGSQTQLLTDALLAMERGASDAATVESLMRAAHSIKGAAAIVGLDVVVQLAHAMEDVFVGVQHASLELTPAHIDVLLSAVDVMTQVSAQAEADVAAWLGQNMERISGVLGAVASINPAQPPAYVWPAAPVRDEDPDELAAAMAAMAALVQVDTRQAPVDAEPAAPVQASASPRPVAQNFDRLLALASQARINAHQMNPFIGQMQRFKRNQGVMFQALEQLHEAILSSGDAALIEKSSQAVQKARPLKQFVLGHLAEVSGDDDWSDVDQFMNALQGEEV